MNWKSNHSRLAAKNRKGFRPRIEIVDLLASGPRVLQAIGKRPQSTLRKSFRRGFNFLVIHKKGV